jgi:N4-gp56 family major capsid protein
MATTTIPFGSPLAKKVFGGAVFAEVSRKRTFSNSMTGPAPGQADANLKLRKEQTPADYPFVRVTDLSKERGDTVSVDLINIVTGKPVMGDKTLQGKRLALKFGTQDIKIDQMRFGIDPGGRMSQKRTVLELRTAGKAAIEGLWGRAMDQISMVHCAGARGDQNTADWVVPLSTDPDFSDIMVNAVKAPSYNRQFYGGDATSIASIDATDIVTLETIDMLRAAIDEMDTPMQPIMLPDDPGAGEKPLYVLWLTSRQWAHLQSHTNATSATGWRTFMQMARERGSKNPLFTGEPGMWNGILVKTMGRAIRFNQGTAVTVTTNANAYTETTSTVATYSGGTPAGRYAVDRALLMGAQGLAQVWGQDSESGMPMRWWEGEEDDGNRYVASVAGMGGAAKISFNDINGVWTDHGIAVVDSYAPDPRFVRIA